MESNTDLTWDVIRAYFKDNSLVKHQIESFNDFVLRKIDETIEGFNVIEMQYQYMPELDKFKHILKIKFTNPILSKPTIFEKDGSTKIMTPNDARLRNFTYASPLHVDIDIEALTLDEEVMEYSSEVKKLNNISLGKIPIMVNSRYCVLTANPDCTNVNQCKYDPGGYFVINGNEKVIISQDRICENKTHVFTNSKLTAYTYIAEIRSVAENKFGVPKTTTLKLSSKHTQYGKYIRVNIHHIKHDLPLFILFKALGVESDKQILQYIVHDVTDPKKEMILKELIGTIHEAHSVTCARDALEYMSKYLQINGYPREIINNKEHRLNILRTILEKEFLPHVGTDFRKKALYLGYMVNKLIHCHLGLWNTDDRDSYVNKRVDSPGVLMANLFRQYYGKMIKDMKNMMQKELNSGAWRTTGKFINIVNKVNVYKIVKSTVIESGMKFALATGNWGIKNNKNKQGVAQVLNRMTFNATLSHLRRVNTPIEKTGKLIQPRKLHATQWGYICCAETPEGASVGLVKNMAMTCNITISSNSNNVRSVLSDAGVLEFDGTNPGIFHNHTKVIVNGDILGIHEDPATLYDMLKDLKRNGAINVYTGISWNVLKNEININTEGGRCARPLYVVNNNTLSLPEWHKKFVATKPSSGKCDRHGNATFGWKDLVLDGHIEYLDVEETNLALIAMKPGDLVRGDKGANKQPRFTHMEVHPSLILGVLAGSIPFSDHNQAPRNCYQCLDPNTTVLMANGDYTPIKDVKIGDEVITFDNKTMQTSVTKVIHQYVRPTENKIYEVETVSGRKIIATGNHNFMTTEGWKATDTFGTHTKIGILTNPKYVSHDIENYTIVDSDSFKSKLEILGLNPSLINKHAESLGQIGLLPLTSTHIKLPIISRLMGMVWTDGSINVYNKTHGGPTGQLSVNFGSLDDADMFETDLESLGFTRTVPIEQNREIHKVMHHTWKVSHNGALPSLMLALDIRIGKRCYTPSPPVPHWVMNGSAMVKREFLAGFQGSDGCQVQINKNSVQQRYVYRCAVTSQSIVPEHKDSLIKFMTQMQTLFEEFGIEMSGVKEIRGNYDKVSIGFKMSDKLQNLIKYFDTIGYRYCSKKSAQSGVAVEFLKYKELTGCDWSEYDSWVSRVEIKGACIFVPVHRITEVSNRMISDITVEHDNHSFIAGENFLSSNSAMGKQAIGVYASNFRHRFDTMAHVLNYPQRPIVETNISKLVHTDEMPCGINVIVAISTFTGFNQEDSVILNKSAIDRGLFSSTYYRTYKEQCNKNHSNGEEEFFTRPNTQTKGIKPFNYEKLNEHGFVPENTYVDSGDIIIGKCMPQKIDTVITHKDTSVSLKNNENGYIDKNACRDTYFTNTNGDGYTFAKIRMRNTRVPTIGDKFCLVPETEVMTLDGWKHINQISFDDKVAQLDEKGLVSYVHPIGIYEFDHQGDMYSIASQQVDLLTTLDHKMYVKKRDSKQFELIKAKDVIGKRVQYKKDGEFTAPVQPWFQFDDTFTAPMNAWLMFLGIWMAEGWVERSCERITISVNKQRVKDMLEMVCPLLGVHIVKNGEKWHIYKIAMYRYLEKLSVGAKNKVLPRFVFNVDCSQVRHLLEGLLCGDGHTTKYNATSYSTSSVELANDVQQLALHAGFSGNLKLVRTKQTTLNDGRIITPSQDYQYTVCIIKTKNEPCMNHGHTKQQTGQTESIIQYDGKVYCIEVPSHVFYVRYNGKGVWTGNSSRHGQKGTMGMHYQQQDMPFTKDGIVPDIIVNPHAIPSRMTIAQLMECLMGKACTSVGSYGDATPFTDLSVEDIATVLQSQGLERHGNEILYNPRTGEQITTTVFIGPTFYQRLKHMTVDKTHSRSSNGPVVLLTRQPAEGRAREGGLRVGEMELDVHLAHGLGSFLKERFMEMADNYRVFTCKKCGMMANCNPEKNIYSCKPCKNTTQFSEIRIPYSAKLLLQELQTMSIAARFVTN